MTIVLVILAVLILLAVLFLIHRVNQVRNSILSIITDYYTSAVKHFINLNSNLDKQANAIITAINDARTDVVRLTNKVEEADNCCKVGLDSLRDIIANLNDRLTAPIDKINDTHNRIKTLGKSATSTDELRDIVGNVVGDIAREAVDDAVNRLTKKPKTTKKVTKEPVTEVKA